MLSTDVDWAEAIQNELQTDFSENITTVYRFQFDLNWILWNCENGIIVECNNVRVDLQCNQEAQVSLYNILPNPPPPKTPKNTKNQRKNKKKHQKTKNTYTNGSQTRCHGNESGGINFVKSQSIPNL